MSTLSTTLIWLAVAVLTVVGLYNLYQGREPRTSRRIAGEGRADPRADPGTSGAGAAGGAPSATRRGEPSISPGPTGLTFEPQDADGVDPVAGQDLSADEARQPGGLPASAQPGSPVPAPAPAAAPSGGTGTPAASPATRPAEPLPGRPAPSTVAAPEAADSTGAGGAGLTSVTAAAGPMDAPTSSATLAPLSRFGPLTDTARAFEPSEIQIPTAMMRDSVTPGAHVDAGRAAAVASTSPAPVGSRSGVGGSAPGAGAGVGSIEGRPAAKGEPPAVAGEGEARWSKDLQRADNPDGTPGADRVAGSDGMVDAAVGPGGVVAARQRLTGFLNPVCDSIVEIQLPSQYGADHLLGISQTLRRAGSKPVLFEGLLQERAGERWVPIVSGQRPATFSRIRAGVLLANRHGPLNAMEFSDFTQNVATLAQQLTASYELPDMKEVLSRARAIDDACIELDAQVSLNVDVKAALGSDEIERFAREQGLVPLGGQRFARLGGRREPLFTLGPVQPPNRLSFLLDVPNAPSAEEPWGRLVHCAKTAAVRLQGHLVDDDGRPLSDAALDQIGEQLGLRHQQLELAGFAAGSPLASRLFS